MNLRDYDLIVVGAGFFGLTIAERVANLLGRKVCVLERRSHIGGNSYSDTDDETGIEYHKYGSHLFHTNNEEVWQYLHRFTKFSNYRHRVFTIHQGKAYPIPINLETMGSFFGRYLSPIDARALIEVQVASENLSTPANFEEKAISLMGRPLYDAFIKGYTKKQWQSDPKDLPAAIIARLPVRFTFEGGYFSDRYEGLPVDGYTAIFTKMVDSPLIDLRLGIDYFDVRDTISPTQLVIYTGPIDRYFDYRAGELGWRTLDFEKEVLPMDDYQGTSVLNFADEDVPYTRVHEFKHLHPERAYRRGSTILYREYSRLATRADEPFYPINTDRDRAMLDAYKAMATQEPNLVTGGRLGSYKYIDMDQAIGAALKIFDHRVVPFFQNFEGS